MQLYEHCRQCYEPLKYPTRKRSSAFCDCHCLDSFARSDPKPDEIRERCLVEQDRWSEKERERRAGSNANPEWQMPECGPRPVWHSPHSPVVDDETDGILGCET